MIDEFIQCILADREPMIGMKEGLQAARVAIKGYESVKLGQPVAI